MAELLATDFRKGHRHEDGLEAAPSPDRSPLRAMRRASGTRVRRRAAAHGLALLHQFRRAEFCAGLGSLMEATMLRGGFSFRNDVLWPHAFVLSLAMTLLLGVAHVVAAAAESPRE